MADKRIAFHNADRRPQYMRHQPSGTPVGWCNHNAHRGKLSLRQMRNHNCRGKNCPFFKKNEEHPHWQQKAKAKESKKQAKREEKLSEALKSEILKALNNLEG